MFIIATYTGQNRDGYIHGSTYKLRITGSMIQRTSGDIGEAGEISYQSLRSFLANWSQIHVLSNGA